MIAFAWNIFLALIWAAATELFNPSNLIIGFVLGYLILLFLRPVFGPSTYFSKVKQSIQFVLFFIWELIRANFRVAYDVVTPTHHMKPGVIAIPLDVESDIEITLLSALITLTPGTLSLDVSDDRTVLYIHAMFVEDPENLRDQIKNGVEKRILELFR